MWLTTDSRFHTIATTDPRAHFTETLRVKLGTLSDRQLVTLDIAVSNLREDVMYAVIDLGYSEKEADYVDADLPMAFILNFREDGGDLMSQLESQYAAIPLRWRLEVVDLIPQYVSYYGPKWKKYKKLAESIRREGRE